MFFLITIVSFDVVRSCTLMRIEASSTGGGEKRKKNLNLNFHGKYLQLLWYETQIDFAIFT